MDGRKNGWENAMKYLEGCLKQEAVADSKEFGISLKTYDKVWNAEYALSDEMSVPTHKLVRDLTKISCRIIMLTEHCKLFLQEKLSEKKMKFSCVVSSSGVEQIEIQVVQEEAEEPLPPAIFFHPLKIVGKFIGEIRYIYLKMHIMHEVYVRE